MIVPAIGGLDFVHLGIVPEGYGRSVADDAQGPINDGRIMKEYRRACFWRLATVAMSVVALNPVTGAPQLPALNPALFAGKPARLDSGVIGEVVRFESHSPAEWADLLSNDVGASVELAGQIFRPRAAQGKMPAIILVPGSGGIAPHHLRQTDALLAVGFVVMLIDPFGGRGIGGTVADQGRLSWAASTYDVGAAFQYLLTRPDVDDNAIGAVGSSRGGTAVMMAAMEPISRVLRRNGHRLRAVVAGYPWCGVQFRNARLTAGTTLLAMSGDRDNWVSLQQCQGAVQALANRGQNARLMIFPGALHAFDREGVPPTEIPGAPTSTTYPTVYMNDAGHYFDLRSDAIDPRLTSDDFTRAAVKGGFIRTGVTVGTQGDQADQYVAEMVRFLREQLISKPRRVAR